MNDNIPLSQNLNGTHTTFKVGMVEKIGLDFCGTSRIDPKHTLACLGLYVYHYSMKSFTSKKYNVYNV